MCRAISSRESSLHAGRRRDGERHPGSREDGDPSRGAVRTKVSVGPYPWGGLPPAPGNAPMTADVRSLPRRGTSSACATTRRQPTRHERSWLALGDASFARSFGPCTSILTTHPGASQRGGANPEVSRSGKPAQAGGTDTGARGIGRSAARRGSLLSQGSVVVRSRKGRRSWPPSLRGIRELGLG